MKLLISCNIRQNSQLASFKRWCLFEALYSKTCEMHNCALEKHLEYKQTPHKCCFVFIHLFRLFLLESQTTQAVCLFVQLRLFGSNKQATCLFLVFVSSCGCLSTWICLWSFLRSFWFILRCWTCHQNKSASLQWTNKPTAKSSSVVYVLFFGCHLAEKSMSSCSVKSKINSYGKYDFY